MQTSLSRLAELFFEYMQGRNAPGTIGYYKRLVLRFLARAGDRDVSTLKKFDLISCAKTWHEIQAVQRLFSWAHTEAELIERNPFKAIKKPRVSGRRRVLSRSDVVRLLRGAAPDFRAYLIAMRETLARPQEIRALRWEYLRSEDSAVPLEVALPAGQAIFQLDEYKARERRADPH